MLPKKNRISRKDFPADQRKGSRVFSVFFSAVFYKTTKPESHISVVVAKKTAKNAVTRNSLRRRFYSAIAKYLTPNPVTAVFYPKKEAITADFKDLESEIEKAFFPQGKNKQN
ncbi:MAG: ribonuclease P protein component [Candidatus Pacebacteria bacterium]|nr:ribonuclease P protein component [Candidatus Paceibacterota bacterium]